MLRGTLEKHEVKKGDEEGYLEMTTGKGGRVMVGTRGASSQKGKVTVGGRGVRD